MDKETFEARYLQRVQEVLEFAISNKYSDFYRRKYKELDIKPQAISSYEDFQQLPMLHKSELLATPLKDRLFTSKKDIVHYAFSSGTTDQDKPLVMPHLAFNYETERTKYLRTYNAQKLAELGVNNIMVLRHPLSSPFLKQIVVPKADIMSVPGDVRNLPLSAKLAKELAINAISSTPTVLTFFIQELEQIGFDLSSIKLAYMTGELSSNQRLAFIKAKLPNAIIEINYTNSELCIIGYRCNHLAQQPPNLYHLHTSAFLEILSESPGKPGNIVATDTDTPRAFPFIRYRFDDVGLLETHECPCGENVVLKLGGRPRHDFLRFHGVVLHVQAIENSLDAVRDFLEPGFQMHVYEELIDERLMPKLVLKVVAKQNASPFLINLIKDNLNQNLFLTADKTLDYFIDNRIFAPLEVEFAPKWPEAQAKARSIISHLT